MLPDQRNIALCSLCSEIIVKCFSVCVYVVTVTLTVCIKFFRMYFCGQMICTVRRLYFDRGACCFWPETKATNCVCSCVRSLRIVTSRMDTLSFVQRCAMWPTHYAKLLGERKLRLGLTLVLGEWACCVLLCKTVARKCLIAVATLNENANVTNGPVWHCKLLGPKS